MASRSSLFYCFIVLLLATSHVAASIPENGVWVYKAISFLQSLTAPSDYCSNHRFAVCKNGGACATDRSRVSSGYYAFNCTCMDGFEGQFCEKMTPCANYHCQNNGICAVNEFSAEPFCQCPAGFSGEFCDFKEEEIEEELVFPPSTCSTMTCFNGGTCVEDLKGDAICLCAEGFSGEVCAIAPYTFAPPVTTTPKQNNGFLRLQILTDPCADGFDARVIIDRLAALLRVKLNFVKNDDGQDAIFVWSKTRGIGHLVSVARNAGNCTADGVEVHLKPEIERCPESGCSFQTLSSVADFLMNSSVDATSQIIGGAVYDARVANQPSNVPTAPVDDSKFVFLTCIASLSVILALVGVVASKRHKIVHVTGTWYPATVDSTSLGHVIKAHPAKPKVVRHAYVNELVAAVTESGEVPPHLAPFTNVVDMQGQTAIHQVVNLASVFSEAKVIAQIDALISAGADAKIQDDSGASPLHYAIRMGCLEVAAHLVDLVDVNAADCNGGSTALYEAIGCDNSELIEKLLKVTGIDVNAAIAINDTALKRCVRLGTAPTLDLLLDHPRLNIDSVGDQHHPQCSGDTALHEAALMGVDEAVVKLLAKGAKPTTGNIDGESPLFVAIASGHASVAGLLLNAVPTGVDLVTPENVNGVTLLDLANSKGLSDIAELLQARPQPRLVPRMPTPSTKASRKRKNADDNIPFNPTKLFDFTNPFAHFATPSFGYGALPGFPQWPMPTTGNPFPDCYSVGQSGTGYVPSVSQSGTGYVPSLLENSSYWANSGVSAFP